MEEERGGGEGIKEERKLDEVPGTWTAGKTRVENDQTNECRDRPGADLPPPPP